MTEQRDNRMVKVCELWERVSQRGTRYFAGYAGPVQYLMFDGGEKDHPTRPGERIHVWRLMVQEANPERRPQRRDPPPTRERAHQETRARSHEVAAEVFGARRDAHGQQLADDFDRRGPDEEPGF